MIFRCLHSRDSQLHNKCSFCSIKMIFISKIPPFVWRVMFKNPQERAVTTTQTNSSIVSVMSTETCQTFFIINPQVVFTIYNQNISSGTVASSIGERDKMSAPSCCVCKTLLAPGHTMTQCYLSRSFFKIKA